MEKSRRLFSKTQLKGSLLKCIDVEEAIISEDLYFKASNKFDKRQSTIKSNRAKSTGGLASGIIKCGHCGYSMRVKHIPYAKIYSCTKAVGGCFTAHGFDNLDAFLSTFLSIKGLIEKAQTERELQLKNELPELYEKENMLRGRIKDINIKMLDLGGSFDAAVFLTSMKAANDELLKIQRQIASVEAIKERKRHHIYNVIESRNLSLDEKRNTVREIFSKIEVFKDYIVFHFHNGDTLKLGKTATSRNKQAKWLPMPTGVMKENTLLLFMDWNALESRDIVKYIDGTITVIPVPPTESTPGNSEKEQYEHYLSQMIQLKESRDYIKAIKEFMNEIKKENK